MENQVVQSYVRNKPLKQDLVEPDNTIAYVMGGSAVIMLAITHVAITMSVVAIVGALYGVRTLIPVYRASKVIEAPTEAVKPKRHYQKRLKVTMYDTGKTIRV